MSFLLLGASLNDYVNAAVCESVGGSETVTAALRGGKLNGVVW